MGLGLNTGAIRAGRKLMFERSPQPGLGRPPPTECLRDSFALEDSSAPCCINFYPPRWSRFPRKALFSFFLVFFFLVIRAHYLNRSRRSISQIIIECYSYPLAKLSRAARLGII